MTAIRVAALVLVASLAACVSGRDCAYDIPEDLRADVLRYVVDKKLCNLLLMSREDYAAAVGGGGRRFEELDVERRRLVAMYANGYSACITDRVTR